MRRRRAILLAALLGAAGCRAAPSSGTARPAPRPPATEFLVSAGDSTFWVTADSDGVHVRGSAMQLARWNGRFYELYVDDDDRSFSDAAIIGQRLYRRDLLTGDSVSLFEDTTIAGIADWYARGYPDDHPLESGESPPDDPHVSATSELDLLEQVGPYVSYTYRADVEVSGGEEWHVARDGVVDLRSGRAAHVSDIAGRAALPEILRRGRRLLALARDSVLASHDHRAREAGDAIPDFRFDAASFALAAVGGAPAVEFAAPGTGERAGGLLLPLPPIDIPAPAWWTHTRAALPTVGADSAGDAWHHGTYDVLARYHPAGDAVHLALRDSAGHQWAIGNMPAPVSHLYWLDGPQATDSTRRALRRAFDEAVLYSADARTARFLPGPRRARPRRVRPHPLPPSPPTWNPGHRATPRPSSPIS